MAELLRWQLGGGRKDWPERFESPFRDTPRRRCRTAGRLVGHATLLIQAAGLNILTDPIRQAREPRLLRRAEAGEPAGHRLRGSAEDPRGADHPQRHDHLDVATLARLWRRDRPRILAPLGNDAIIWDEDLGSRSRPAIGGSRSNSAKASPPISNPPITGQRGRDRPAHGPLVRLRGHDAGRRDLPSRRHTYGDGRIFTRVRERFGAPRLAILPIGAYEPRWFMQPQHMNPEEAVRVRAMWAPNRRSATIGARSA